jgi:hypothetical protein
LPKGGRAVVSPLFASNILGFVKMKFPDVTLGPLTARPLKVTPLIVVLTTPGAPTLNAPTSDPLVTTSVSPLMAVGAPHVTTAAWVKLDDIDANHKPNSLRNCFTAIVDRLRERQLLNCVRNYWL